MDNLENYLFIVLETSDDSLDSNFCFLAVCLFSIRLRTYHRYYFRL
jgi:hypothetical protein